MFKLIAIVVIALSLDNPVACDKCLECRDPSDPATWCPDTYRDGYINVTDILEVLSNWGKTHHECIMWRYPDCLVERCINCHADTNGDDYIDVKDLLLVLAAFD